MTANHSTPSDGESPAEPSDEHEETAASAALDADPNREVLSVRLDVLGTRTAADLHGLAARIEAGDDVDVEEVREARANLRRADATLRRHLDAPEEPELSREDRDPRTRSLDGFGEVEDADHLRDAPIEEVAHRLASDVHDLRSVADRVDRNLYAEELTDHDAEELWAAGARIAAWGRDVLSFRTDRDDLLSREEGEALDRSEEGEDA
jgi:hypothetical protein